MNKTRLILAAPFGLVALAPFFVYLAFAGLYCLIGGKSAVNNMAKFHEQVAK